MPYTSTLAQLRQRAVRQADMEAQLGLSKFLTVDEVNGYINDSAAELHDILVLRFADYAVRKWQFSLVANQDEYPVPDDFYKLRAVYFLTSTVGPIPQRARLRQFMEEEREMVQSTTIAPGVYGDMLRYRLEDNVIGFAPGPIGGGIIELRYIYQAPKMLNDNDAIGFQCLGGWEEYIVVDAAIKCRDKGELSTDRLNARKAGLYKRIEVAASDRDIGSPQRVVDSYAWNRWL